MNIFFHRLYRNRMAHQMRLARIAIAQASAKAEAAEFRAIMLVGKKP